ncbi:MAG: ABC transporter permease [Lachnoclostridium sp.]|jgi:F0F1-type ATP synthase assembly protein I
MDFYRAFHSVGFLVGILATVTIFCFGSVGMVSHNVSAVAAFNNTFKYNNISELLILSTTFAYVASFCIDWQTKFAYSIVIRSNKTVYALSKCIVSAVVGGLSVVIGAVIFIGCVCLTQTSILPEAIMIEVEFTNEAFGDLLLKGEALLFFLSYLYIIFLQAIFFSSLGLMVSAYLPNRYVAYIAPFTLSFMLNQVANVFDLPIWLDPVKLATARVYGKSTFVVLGMASGTFLCLTIVCDILFIRTVKRRIANG